jgi:chromosome segregation ATPase
METDQAQKRVEQSIEIRQATQKAEDKWAEERERLKAEYEELEGEYDRLSAEKRELEAETAARRASVEAIEKEIAQVARISNELTPFLEQTYDRLAALVKEDVPFLRDERKRRLETLRQTMDDPLISAGEKYRKVMEALLVEAEYGNTMEIYPEEIVLDDQKIQVNVFRLGRISLFFQTLDGKTSGYFDPATFEWKVFSPEYSRQIRAAIEMGAKQRPLDLVVLPIGRLVRE